MSGGDMHVRVHTSYGQFAVNQVIDANSTAKGNMTTPVQVDGQTVYMTSEGAAHYESLRDNSYGTMRFSAHSDTRTERCGFLWLFTKQVDNVPKGFGEGHLGNPNEE